jgi:hypothetical protein
LRAGIPAVTAKPIRHVIQHSYASRPRLRQSGFNRRGAVFFGHKKPAERIGRARAVLPRKIFELMGPELVPDCIVAPTHLIVGETAIDLGGRVLKLKANEAPPQTGEVYGRGQSG